MKKLYRQLTIDKALELLAVGLMVFLAYLVVSNNVLPPEKYNNSDIHRGFQRGMSVSQGVNPYLEFNPNLMLDQEKVPGFFPLYFYAMSVIAKLAKYSFIIYLDILRWLVFVSYISLGVTVYLLMRSRGRLIAYITLAILLFNRWTINDVIELKQDTYVLLLLMLSLMVLKTRTKASFLLYGLATGIKHLTIFVLPVYFLELLIMRKNLKKNLGTIVVSSLLFLAPLVIPAIPYLVKSPQNFINALLYNGTRVPEANDIERNSGLDKLLVLYNQDRFNSPVFYAFPRLPMIIIMLICITALFRGRIDTWQYCALAYVVFVAFNPVLYGQYFTWAFTFIMFLLPVKRLAT